MIERWEPEITAFERLDERCPPSINRIVFYGSSTIRLSSTLDLDFAEIDRVNRGFGGAALKDVADLAARAIGNPAPRQVILYAGGNDLAALRTVEETFDHLERFTSATLERWPEVEIGIVSVLPHLRFWPLIDQIVDYNEHVRGLAIRERRLSFIDAASKMLQNDSPPSAQLFISDGIHLSSEGYAVLTQVCREHLSLL